MFHNTYYSPFEDFRRIYSWRICFDKLASKNWADLLQFSAIIKLPYAENLRVYFDHITLPSACKSKQSNVIGLMYKHQLDHDTTMQFDINNAYKNQFNCIMTSDALGRFAMRLRFRESGDGIERISASLMHKSL